MKSFGLDTKEKKEKEGSEDSKMNDKSKEVVF